MKIGKTDRNLTFLFLLFISSDKAHMASLNTSANIDGVHTMCDHVEVMVGYESG